MWWATGLAVIFFGMIFMLGLTMDRAIRSGGGPNTLGQRFARFLAVDHFSRLSSRPIRQPGRIQAVALVEPRTLFAAVNETMRRQAAGEDVGFELVLGEWADRSRIKDEE